MSRYFIVGFIMLALASFLGWFSVTGATDGRQEIRDPWPDNIASNLDVNVDDVRARLNASSLFPKANTDKLGPNGTSVSGSNGQKIGKTGQSAPPFPGIRGVSFLDGLPHVTLQLDNGDVRTVSEGETLDSGWILKSVDRVRLVAVYKDEEITRPIRDYAPGE